MKKTLINTLLVILLIPVLLFLPGGNPVKLQAQQTNTERALIYTSETYNIPVKSLKIAAEATGYYPTINEAIWTCKIIDISKSSPSVYSVTIDSKGNFVNKQDLDAREKAAFKARYGKLTPKLYEILQTKGDDDIVYVWIGLADVDYKKADAKLEAKYPQFSFYEGKPLQPGSTYPPRYIGWDLLSAIIKDHDTFMQEVTAEAARPLVEYLQEKGYKPHAFDGYPYITVSLPKKIILEILNRDDVGKIEEDEGGGNPRPASDSAAQTDRAPGIWDSGVTGSNIKVAVIETTAGSGAVDFNNKHLKQPDEQPGGLHVHRRVSHGLSVTMPHG